MSDIPALVTERPELQALWHRRSFLELDARARAFALLDDGTGQEYCDPFDRIESPWLEPQGLVPQADDGVVLVKGRLAGEPCVMIGIEGAFQGGSIGEVSGAKATCALQLAARDARQASRSPPSCCSRPGEYASRRARSVSTRWRRSSRRSWSCAACGR